MEQGGFRYQPALDGIRAFAVTAVIFYHLGYHRARGGFLGVDTFFVLSGFLITSLLLREQAGDGRISLSAFWARRARRLLPALFLLLLVVVVFASTTMTALELNQLRGDAIASLFYVANWHFIATGQSYFSQFLLTPSPLQHLWSLAIEEQFYLLWPLAVVGVMALWSGTRRAMFVVIIAGIALSQLTMVRLYNESDPSRAYYGTESRAHTLLVGCLLALLLSGRLEIRGRLGRALPTLGVLAFAACLVAYSTVEASARLFYGGDLVFAILVAIVIAAAVQPAGRLRSFLGLSPLRYVGRISYGLYLWHWPVIIFVTAERTGLVDNQLNAVRLTITVAITLASYYLLEQPILRGALKPPVGWVVLPASIGVVLVVILVSTTAGVPIARSRVNHVAGPCGSALPEERRAARKRLAELGVPQAEASRHLRVLVVGDSRACSLLTGLEVLGRAEGVQVDNAAVLGCGVVADAVAKSISVVPRTQADRCHDMVRTAQLKALKRGLPDVIIWYSGWEQKDLEVDGHEVQFGTSESDALLRSRFEAMYRRLHRAGSKLLIIQAPVSLPVTPIPWWLTGEIYANNAHLKVLYQEFAARHPGEIFLADLAARLCPHHRCAEKVKGFRTEHLDATHFSPGGSAWAAVWLWPQLLAAVTPGSAPVAHS